MIAWGEALEDVRGNRKASLVLESSKKVNVEGMIVYRRQRHRFEERRIERGLRDCKKNFIINSLIRIKIAELF